MAESWYSAANVVSARPSSEDVERFVLDVRVAESRGETRHEVTLTKKDHARLARASETAEAFVERCFVFLLAREPEESIAGTRCRESLRRLAPAPAIEFRRCAGRASVLACSSDSQK